MNGFGIIIGSQPLSPNRYSRLRSKVETGEAPAAPICEARGLARGSRPIDRHVSANFYPTPPEATRALLSVESFEGSIWEPACGKGHIAKVLKDAGHSVVSTDLNDWGFGLTGRDFLSELRPRAKHIVTNPPYGSGLADAFIEKALSFTRSTGGKMAMLLNLASLAHAERTAFWKSNPPARLYAIDGIVCWPDRTRAPPRHFTQNRYVWAVWTSGHKGPSAFWWLSAADFRLNPASRNKIERTIP
jgi:hypothetical protein